MCQIFTVHEIVIHCYQFRLSKPIKEWCMLFFCVQAGLLATCVYASEAIYLLDLLKNDCVP